MNTPIADFVKRYAESEPLRLHMPGHKGASFLGCEAYDITEVEGADSLYEADGIIRESEENAGKLFGCPTFYSTEGSSQCIRAMMYLICLNSRTKNGEKRRPLVLAGRNAHKTFILSAAMLDFDLQWLVPEDNTSYLSCNITADEVEQALRQSEVKPDALYLTSPDYLGNMPDIAAIAEVCRAYGVLFAVDNAHGAYLKFLPESMHPIDLGADICCDSAHKTLPVLTGGAYLHISEKAPSEMLSQVKHALAMFGSTSPSYLILQSLDLANAYLAGTYPDRLSGLAQALRRMKAELAECGYTVIGNEPMKLTIAAKDRGYTGRELADILLEKNIVCEFSDPDFLVMMFTPEIGESSLQMLKEALLSVPAREKIHSRPPYRTEKCLPERVMTPREAAFSQNETVPISESEGRVLAVASVGCPPAVPIIVSGERIDKAAIEAFGYYGINKADVVKRGKEK